MITCTGWKVAKAYSSPEINLNKFRKWSLSLFLASSFLFGFGLQVVGPHTWGLLGGSGLSRNPFVLLVRHFHQLKKLFVLSPFFFYRLSCCLFICLGSHVWLQCPSVCNFCYLGCQVSPGKDLVFQVRHWRTSSFRSWECFMLTAREVPGDCLVLLSTLIDRFTPVWFAVLLLSFLGVDYNPLYWVSWPHLCQLLCVSQWKGCCWTKWAERF